MSLHPPPKNFFNLKIYSVVVLSKETTHLYFRGRLFIIVTYQGLSKTRQIRNATYGKEEILH